MTEEMALEAEGVAKAYGHVWALRDCTFAIPSGRIAALVGPNGSGKSTLLRMAAGLTRPTEGAVRVLGRSLFKALTETLSQIGYLDQERPLYRSFAVGEMLRFGERLNPRWDAATARRHLDDLGIGIKKKVGALSVGQQAQVALTLCLAKRPRFMLLDEPVAALDPLAREGIMQILLSTVAETSATVLLSSHAISELANVCDYLIILAASRVALADDLDYVLASHRLVTGPSAGGRPVGLSVVHAQVDGRQTSILGRVEAPISDPAWLVEEPSLEEIVIAYLKAAEAGCSPEVGAGDDTGGRRPTPGGSPFMPGRSSALPGAGGRGSGPR